jgi:hypothetical protein
VLKGCLVAMLLAASFAAGDYFSSRLPRSAACPDYSDPAPGSRKPKPANGTWFIGWSIAGHELWVI